MMKIESKSMTTADLYAKLAEFSAGTPVYGDGTLIVSLIEETGKCIIVTRVTTGSLPTPTVEQLRNLLLLFSADAAVYLNDSPVVRVTLEEDGGGVFVDLWNH